MLSCMPVSRTEKWQIYKLTMCRTTASCELVNRLFLCVRHHTQQVISSSPLRGVYCLLTDDAAAVANRLSRGQHVRGMDSESETSARILWDYLCLHQPLEKSDVIIGLGCHDLRVAERSADLFLEGWAPWLLFTGCQGNQTAGVWTRREADVFMEVALRMGVPRHSILLETEATNTGENIRFSHRVLKESNTPASRLILVQQPFMERRVCATFQRQWPDGVEHTRAIITSPQMDMSAYPHPSVGTASDLITYMLGVLERIRDYPQKGFQVEQQVTQSVLSAYHWLLQAGYCPK